MSAGEDASARARRRNRVDDREEQSRLVAYETETGEQQVLTGDDDAPYTAPLGRASSDGTSGLVVEPNGVNQRFALDEYGRLWIRGIINPIPAVVQQFTYSRYTTAGAAESQHTVKAAAGKVHHVRCIVSQGITTDRIMMIFDAAGAVGNGAAPIWRALLSPPGPNLSGEVADGFGDFGPLICATGIVVALSTTIGTLTLPGSAEGFFEVLYE